VKLTDLRIELEKYGDNRGKYTGTIKYEGERGNVKLLLDPEVSNALLNFIGPVITKFATRAALDIEKNLQESVSAASQQPLIEQ
jgi:hypothetical protein